MTNQSVAVAPASSHTRKPLLAWIVVVIIAAGGIARTLPAIRTGVRDRSVDVLRQWRTSQYVLDRVNPYPIGLAALKAKYGSQAAADLRNIRIYTIPKEGPDPRTRKDIGPPEATYPPTSSLILAFTIGRLPADAVLVGWPILNVVLLCLIVYELIRLDDPSRMSVWSFLFLLSVALIWPPTSEFFTRGQFSLIVLWSVLVAERLGNNYGWLSGILYAIALIKPSLGLPFLLLPIIRRRWTSFVWTFTIEILLLLGAGWFLRASPAALISDWLAVSRYFMQGMYTLQEIINDLHLGGTLWDIVLPALVVGGIAVLIRNYEPDRRLAMFSFLAVIWTYHYPYDFVILICLIAFLLAPFNELQKWDFWQWSAVIALVILGIALTRSAIGGNDMVWRLARWGGRFALISTAVAVARARRFQLVAA